MSTNMKEEAVSAVKLVFSKEKETKNTVKFTEEGDSPIIGSLYVQKSAIAGLGNPDKVEVTVGGVTT